MSQLFGLYFQCLVFFHFDIKYNNQALIHVPLFVYMAYRISFTVILWPETEISHEYILGIKRYAYFWENFEFNQHITKTYVVLWVLDTFFTVSVYCFQFQIRQ